jgi:hypothetical protein
MTTAREAQPRRIPQLFSGFSVLLLGAALGGCGAQDGVNGDELGEVTSTIWTEGAASGDPPEWNSGNTSNLSAWQSVMCTQTYGQDWLLTGMRGYDDNTFPDDFVARLDVTCSHFWNDPHALYSYYPDGQEHADVLLYSGDYKAGATAASVFQFGTMLPAGVELYVNPNSYVNSVRLLYVRTMGDFLGDYGSPGRTGWTSTGGIPGTQLVTLLCPDQDVMTGIAVRYSTTSGKIRDLKIYCRSLDWTP